jgi:hypothetical protein
VTPEQLAEYDTAVQEVFERVVGLLGDAGWSKPKHYKDVTIWTRSVPGSALNMTKSEMPVTKPFDLVLSKLSEVLEITPDMPADERDGMIRHFLMVAEPNPFKDDFVYVAGEAPAKIISLRDFLIYRKHFERDGAHFFVQTSIVNDKIMPE